MIFPASLRNFFIRCWLGNGNLSGGIWLRGVPVERLCMMKERIENHCQELESWLNTVLEQPFKRLSLLPGDASVRRYFRVYCKDITYVAMDASLQKESCEAFIAIAKAFYKLGLNVPVIYAEDKKQGFLLLTDFGDQLYAHALNKKTADELYRRAFNDLLRIQSCQKIEDYALPQFTADLYYQEMSWFRDWYLEKYLKTPLSLKEEETLENIFQLLIKTALSQPQICAHRDYHSRNLMVVANHHQPGILDFQDALYGPVTYDLLSLLRDCYIDWPIDQVETWVLAYQRQACQAGLLEEKDEREFLRWFDWIGLQRHLKCIGLFARLNERDGKPLYLQYIPRVMRYAWAVCERYSEFKGLKSLLEKR
ncbi:aminoglycoside phosphotransferase family protein [Coxiella burnetii]|uniref:7.5 kDa chlorosome protein n=1 Tax=Coxiella burnetii (strain Dugway 5J108-111) TaxID=434922 RepID=A9KGZ4_COXBN|nr:phosphotransferase [Coxiella burnetii]ABS76764.2 7.5 kDa chlorosome protein [Coxiella burnetii Dugway 5J108-111]ACJ21129.1 7.5 kDa chlorosome protein [Coxiella burnetii CbuK_Q154]ATN86685.1 phosphotransferase [Coxiella burnetii str. Schperling]EAX33626.3 phosphotransferase [Coxiella burnetii 'MSU Goat Q177']OYK79538.1 phosphotransferase [Coxiella burnetii]